MTRYAMAIDTTSCVACHACAIACKSNNNLPNNVRWSRVDTDGGTYMDTAAGTYPNELSRTYFPVTCQHCGKPGCVEVCASGASYKREEDGIVMVDSEVCIGCGSCIEACPYDVRTLFVEDFEYYVDFPLGDFDAPKHVSGTTTKCTFCINRIERDSVPACMELCPGRARYWGDMDDPQSEISLFLEGKDYVLLQEEAGTGPNCYYIV